MVKLLNKKLPRYRGKALAAGQPFDASNRDARVLLATQMAEPDLGTYAAPSPSASAPRVHPLDGDRNGAPGGSLPHNPPSLRGKSKAKLLEIAKAEHVSIADPEASNSVIIAAIEAKRAGSSE